MFMYVRHNGSVCRNECYNLNWQFIFPRKILLLCSLFLKNNEGKLTTLQLIGMVRGVASGMVYLSAINFVHRVSKWDLENQPSIQDNTLSGHVVRGLCHIILYFACAVLIFSNLFCCYTSLFVYHILLSFHLNLLCLLELGLKTKWNIKGILAL